MRQFIIIDIEQNTVQPEGEVLIVKANEVKQAEGFEWLEEMFGKQYFQFEMNESNETEVFMLPYSEELTQRLVRLAHRYEDGSYWTPNMDDFMDARLSTPKGIITIHKSITLVRKRRHIDKPKFFLPDYLKHKVINGLKIVTFSVSKAFVSCDMAFFVLPDDDENMQILNNVIKLRPQENQFWEPDISDFYHNRVSMRNIIATTEHDLYISYGLPKDVILENIQTVLE